ncbi:hypothetical protein I7I51_05050 [Histoplasma capsulatum]|uniref:Secreted protein n=1 Tax=Ajellomyces capsulatus TaxID=5037 RepID=A0A8A1M677_AJECA|nr:hypothetical protein I7I51_05050 [Histoplasma capsulatum]
MVPRLARSDHRVLILFSIARVLLGRLCELPKQEREAPPWVVADENSGLGNPKADRERLLYNAYVSIPYINKNRIYGGESGEPASYGIHTEYAECHAECHP